MFIVAAVTLVAVAGTIGYQLGKNQAMDMNPQYPSPTQQPDPTSDPNGVACTMDAKICPDGSAVGRIPPNCEFATCPQSLNDACVNHLGEPQDSGACANIPDEARSCRANGDCIATCSKGCVSSSWMSNNTFADCAAMPTYSCACLNNECRAE